MYTLLKSIEKEDHFMVRNDSVNTFACIIDIDEHGETKTKRNSFVFTLEELSTIAENPDLSWSDSGICSLVARDWFDVIITFESLETLQGVYDKHPESFI